MEKIILEEIISSTELPLSNKEKFSLITRRNKKAFYILSIYLTLALVLVYVIATGPGIVSGKRGVGELTDEDRGNFWTVAPVFCAFLFVLLSIFFIRYYLQAVHPLVKDIKKGTKLLLLLRLEKRDPFFNRFFIYTPIRKTRQIEISGEDYYQLKQGAVTLVITPHSHEILQLLNGEQEVLFHLPVAN